MQQMLRQDERVDRRNHNIFIAVNYECRMCNLLQGGVTTYCRYGSPFSDRGKLRHGRVPGHRKVTILLARGESLHVLTSSRLAGFGGGEECSQQERNRIRLFFRRYFGEGHAFSTGGSSSKENHASH